MGIPDHLTCLLQNLYVGQEATLRTGREKTGSKQEKESVKAVYCHPAYLTYMQSTSGEMPSWMKHKLESRLLGEISITSDMQICLSTMRETRVQSLGWEDPMEKEMAIHSSTIAWKIPWTEEPGRLQSTGSQRVGHD